jgi:hypothetical protein
MIASVTPLPKLAQPDNNAGSSASQMINKCLLVIIEIPPFTDRQITQRQ